MKPPIVQAKASGQGQDGFVRLQGEVVDNWGPRRRVIGANIILWEWIVDDSRIGLLLVQWASWWYP